MNIYYNIMKSLPNITQKINRRDALEQGFYDGRFRTRKVKDSKKESNKRWCRSTNFHTTHECSSDGR